MPTTLPMGGGLALDGGEQVGDVVAFQEEAAQRLERRPPGIRRRVRLCIPLLAGRGERALVLVALGLDRLARRGEARRQRGGIGARLAQIADLVELLVEREDLLQ